MALFTIGCFTAPVVLRRGLAASLPAWRRGDSRWHLDLAVSSATVAAGIIPNLLGRRRYRSKLLA